MSFLIKESVFHAYKICVLGGLGNKYIDKDAPIGIVISIDKIRD